MPENRLAANWSRALDSGIIISRSAKGFTAAAAASDTRWEVRTGGFGAQRPGNCPSVQVVWTIAAFTPWSPTHHATRPVLIPPAVRFIAGAFTWPVTRRTQSAGSHQFDRRRSCHRACRPCRLGKADSDRQTPARSGTPDWVGCWKSTGQESKTPVQWRLPTAAEVTLPSPPDSMR